MLISLTVLLLLMRLLGTRLWSKIWRDWKVPKWHKLIIIVASVLMVYKPNTSFCCHFYVFLWPGKRPAFADFGQVVGWKGFLFLGINSRSHFIFSMMPQFFIWARETFSDLRFNYKLRDAGRNLVFRYLVQLFLLLLPNFGPQFFNRKCGSKQWFSLAFAITLFFLLFQLVLHWVGHSVQHVIKTGSFLERSICQWSRLWVVVEPETIFAYGFCFILKQFSEVWAPFKICLGVCSLLWVN